MTNYLISSGYNENGGDITLNAAWEHEFSELRCLAVARDKEHQSTKVLNASSITGSNGVYTIKYPFETQGLAWGAYLWRETTLNGTVEYNGSRIPVEAMVAKLEELNDKIEEAKADIKRALMTPEDAEGKMFVPPVEVRNGDIVGFDENGNVVTGAACPQVAELLLNKKVIEEAYNAIARKVEEAIAEADKAQSSANQSKRFANDAKLSERNALNSANTAKSYYELTKTESKDAKETTFSSVNAAKGYAGDAEAAADRAEAARNELVSKTDAINKAVCYVGCAAKSADESLKRVEQKEGEIGVAIDEAKQELSEAKQAAVGEIEAFTDVYKKTETYSKAQIDGVDTGAEVVLKMNEIHAQLKDYEAVTGETLPNEFWVEVFNAFERWQANSNEVKEWITTSATESSNPYFSEAPTKPVVDFNVKLAKSTHSLRVASFNPNTNVDVYLPSATNINDIMSFSTKRTGRIIAPNAAYADYLVCGNTEEYTETIYLNRAVSIRYIANSAQKFNGRVIARKAKDATGAFYLAYAYNQDTRFESADNCFALLSNAIAFAGTLEVPLCQRADRIVEKCRKFNHSVYLPLCSTAKDGFKDTAMSAENISATLDSLPTWTDGESHVITFTGSPGCAELTQESPSVAAAIAKGWTVEL